MLPYDFKFGVCRLFLVLLFCASFAGCHKLHSNGVTITTVNNSQQRVDTIEIDYPGGSYGIGSLAPSGSRVRWIKPNGSATLRIDFIDSTGEHQAKPLILQSEDSGAIVLHILDGGKVSAEDKRNR